MKIYIEINCRKKASMMNKEAFYRKCASTLYLNKKGSSTIELVRVDEVQNGLKAKKRISKDV